MGAIVRPVIHWPTPFSPSWLPNCIGDFDVSDPSSLVIDGSNRVSGFINKAVTNPEVVLCANSGSTVACTAPNVTVTGSQVFEAEVTFQALENTVVNRTFISKQSGNSGFAFQTRTSGKLGLRIGDGTTLTQLESTVNVPWTAFTRVKYTAEWTDGVGVIFKVDGVQLGDPVPSSAILANANVVASVGADLQNTIFHRVQVLGVYDFNPALASRFATSFVSGGATWSLINANYWLADKADLYQGTLSAQPIYTVGADGRPYLAITGAQSLSSSCVWTYPQPATDYWVGQKTLTSTSGNPTLFWNVAGSQWGVYLIATGGWNMPMNVGLTPGDLPHDTDAVYQLVNDGFAGNQKSRYRVNRGPDRLPTVAAVTTPRVGVRLGAAGAGSTQRVYQYTLFGEAHGLDRRNRVTVELGKKWRIAV